MAGYVLFGVREQALTMHQGLQRNFHVMPGAEWLEPLCRRIPDRYEHLVRSVGWYSNRARRERARALKVKTPATKPPTQPEPVSAFAARAKASWARLIRKVYEADPLERSKRLIIAATNRIEARS